MKLRKKIRRLLVITAFAVLLDSSMSFATTGIITGETVRLREKPTTSSSIMANLDQNEKVDVIKQEGDWYTVSYKGKEGYVSKTYIKVNGEIIQNEPSTPDVTEEKTDSVKEENEISLSSNQKLKKATKIYALPLISSTIKTELKENDSISILDSINNWTYISSNAGNGWVIKKDLVITNDEKPNDETAVANTNNENITEITTQENSSNNNNTGKVEETKKENKKGYVNVENANIRKKPTTDSEEVDTLTLNTVVTIIGEEDNWYKIQVDNKVAYIYKKLVSDEKVTSKSTSRSAGDRTQKEEQTEEIVEKSSETKGNAIVDYAKQFLGHRYVSGGNGPDSFDCSGFTKYVYEHFKYTLSRTTGEQAKNGKEVSRSDLQQGDLLIFLNDSKSSIGHVGIYIGNDTFIHAANPKRGVVTDSIYSTYYGPRFVTARRII